MARKAFGKVPLVMLLRGNMTIPMQQYGTRITQKSWLNRPRLGLPWKTRPLCGNRMRTVLNTTLKRAELVKRT